MHNKVNQTSSCYMKRWNQKLQVKAFTMLILPSILTWAQHWINSYAIKAYWLMQQLVTVCSGNACRINSVHIINKYVVWQDKLQYKVTCHITNRLYYIHWCVKSTTKILCKGICRIKCNLESIKFHTGGCNCRCSCRVVIFKRPQGVRGRFTFSSHIDMDLGIRVKLHIRLSMVIENNQWC